MINLDFKYAEARNFLCFGPQGIKIDFKAYGNIVHIRGENLDVENEEERIASNGVGKSSIPEIIVYALFGKTIKQPTKIKHNNVINNKIGKNLYVEVKWGDFRVVRTRKPDTLRLWQSADAIWGTYVICPSTNEKIVVDGKAVNSKGETFEYSRDQVVDTEISLGGIPATQELLLSKLGMTYETFVNIFIFTDNNAGAFLESDTPDKRKFVENLLALDKYRLFGEAAKKLRNSYKETIKSISQSYESLLNEAQAGENRIVNYKAKEKAWVQEKNAELDALLSEFKNKSEELKKTDIGDALDKYNNAVAEIAQIEATNLELEQKKEKVSKILENVNSKIAVARDEKNRISSLIYSSKEKIKNINKSIEEKSLETSKLHNHTGKSCNFCKSIIKKENYELYVQKTRDEIEAAKQELLATDAELTTLKESEGTINAQIESLLGAIGVANEKTNESNIVITKNKARIRALSTIQKPESGTNELLIQSQLQDISHRIEQKKQEVAGVSPFESIIQMAKDEWEAKKIEVLNKNKELTDAEELLPYYEFWVKAFGDSGIRKFVIDGIIPALNARCNYWLQYLIDGRIQIHFNNELEETIERFPVDGDPFVYAAMSGGERRRLCLAVCNAFAHIMVLSSGRTTSCIFLDEVTTNIDPIGVVGVYNMILEMAKDRQVFITTHDQGLLAMLEGCEVIKLQKKDGFTTLAKDGKTPAL
jgi:DNA repair exonuclease SbcCD ATPase subunit